MSRQRVEVGCEARGGCTMHGEVAWGGVVPLIHFTVPWCTHYLRYVCVGDVLDDNRSVNGKVPLLYSFGFLLLFLKKIE
jgi:hypothetical protein